MITELTASKNIQVIQVFLPDLGATLDSWLL